MMQIIFAHFKLKYGETVKNCNNISILDIWYKKAFGDSTKLLVHHRKYKRQIRLG
jgi:hypothetical protein